MNTLNKNSIILDIYFILCFNTTSAWQRQTDIIDTNIVGYKDCGREEIEFVGRVKN
jgi:hypothetical protein